MSEENKEHPCLYGEYYSHDWGYKSEKERICVTCGRKEIFIPSLAEASSCDDGWRLKYEENEKEDE